MRTFILAFFGLFHLLCAEIIECYSSKGLLEDLPKDTWVFVDLDNCLFEGMQALGHANWFYDEVAHRMELGMSKNEAIRDFYPHWIITQAHCQVKAVDPDLIPQLQHLQKQGFAVMGLTHRQPLVAESTLKQLKPLGVDFAPSSPYKGEFLIGMEDPAIYTQGVLFVGDYNSKGDVLFSFLERIQKMPKRVLFLDDKLRNVEDLASVLEPLGVNYTGIHCRAIERVEPVYQRDLVDAQYEALRLMR